jgi:uncharacterized membrane protein YkvA (DUF1232 family)
MTIALVPAHFAHTSVTRGLPLETPVKKLWVLLWRMSKGDLRLLWFALKHDARPGWLLPVTGLMALYAIAPFNLAIPVLGVVDDMVLLPLALHYVLKLLPLPITQGFFAGNRRGRGMA